MRNRVLAALAGIIALGVCITASAAPIEAYSRLPAMSDVDISDDGQAVAYVSNANGQGRVVVQRLDGAVLQTISLGDMKVRDLMWVGPDYVVVTTSVTRAVEGLFLRGENFQGLSINVRTGAVTQLMNRVHGTETYTNIMLSSPTAGVWEGEHVLFVSAYAGARGSEHGRVDVVRVALDDGRIFLHQMGDSDSYGYLVTTTGSVIAKEMYDNDSRRWSVAVRRDGGWRQVYQVDAPIESPDLVGLSEDGSAIMVNLWDDQAQIWRPTPITIATGQVGQTPLPEQQVGLITDRDYRMIGYAHTDVFTEYTFTRPDLAAAWQRVAGTLRDRQVRISAATPDFSRMVLYVEGTGMPGNYLLYDVAAGSLTQIGRAYPDIPPNELAEVRHVTYNAADGLEIHAYLTLPPGRGQANLPLVVLPHGGPEARDVAGFDWMAQSLASRGYVVLQPNFRGSTGYGQEFLAAGWGEYGRKMQTDVSDGVTYLAQRGIVDPSRVCVMGASYGGYVALAGVTMQNGIYRCAVSIAGVSDAGAQLDYIIQRGGRDSPAVRHRMRYLGIEQPGDPRLQQLSPRRAARNGNAPVLLIHGRDDIVVPYFHSAQMQDALREAGRPVELVTLQAEDHWLSREATRIQTMNAAIAFLEQHNPPN